MVPENVDHAVAKRTKVFGSKERNAEATLQHWHEKFGSHFAVVVLGRTGMQPPACVWGRDEGKVSLKR